MMLTLTTMMIITAPDIAMVSTSMLAIARIDTPRGPIKFDHLGNVIGDFYIRHLEKAGGKYINKTVKTYNNVSQFWTYKEDEFLKQPVYSRDFPPCKYCE